jgi:hypothetical protein
MRSLFYLAGSGTEIGSIPQISLAYSAIVLSLLNLPDRTEFRIAIFAHLDLSLYNVSIFSYAAMYSLKSYATR